MITEAFNQYYFPPTPRTGIERVDSESEQTYQELWWLVRTLRIPDAPPVYTRNGASIGIGLLDAALAMQHITGISEDLRLEDRKFLSRTTTIDLSLDALTEAQVVAAQEFGRFYQRYSNGFHQQNEQHTIWVPVVSVRRDAIEVLSITDSTGTALLKAAQSDLTRLLNAAMYRMLRTDRTRAWLDGYERGGRSYEPVIRAEPTGDDIVTWGEFVELGYLREYRRKEVPLQRLRPVIAALREEYQTPYPLATAKPFVHGRDLVLMLQQETVLPQSLAIVVQTGQTIGLADEANRFFRKVEFDPDESVCRIRPAGSASPVVIDPLLRFGWPSVSGVGTERLWELHDAGETIEEVAEGYEISLEDVRAAVAYEEQLRSTAA